MLNELKARLKYTFLALFAKDGSWSMGADLAFSAYPLGGVWLMGQYRFNTYAEAMAARYGGEAGPCKKGGPP